MSKPLTLADLKWQGKNPRKRTQRSLAQTENSLQKYGAWRSIAVDENLNITAGRGTVEAAANVGIERVKVVEADGNEIVAVMRKGLSEEQKREYMYADNRSAETSEWDEEVVSEDSDKVALNLFWFPNELAKFKLSKFEPAKFNPSENMQRERCVTCPECGARFDP